MWPVPSESFSAEIAERSMETPDKSGEG